MQSDMLLFASTYEGFGLPIVEAQAVGRPVVTSDLGAAVETVLAPPRAAPQERTGWTVPPNDPEALAEALREALDLGATARDNLARRARAHVLKHFSLEQMIAQTLDAYIAMLQARPPSGPI